MRRPSTPRTLLRTALLLDAVASGAMGLALALGAGPLAGLLRLPEPLLRVAGLALVPYALLVARVGTREEVPHGGAVAVVALNGAWVVASALLLAIDGLVTPTALGSAFVVAQALVVLAFAEAQWIGLRREARAAGRRAIA